MQAAQPAASGSSAVEAGAAPGGGAREVVQLRGEVEALVEQLAEEAELASTALDRAEAAEAEVAHLRTQQVQRLEHGHLDVADSFGAASRTVQMIWFQ